MIWFSASWIRTSLPNSLGLFALLTTREVTWCPGQRIRWAFVCVSGPADNLGVRFKYAEQLSVGLGVAAEHPLACLAQHLLDSGNHLIQVLLGFVHY